VKGCKNAEDLLLTHHLGYERNERAREKNKL
jgi:hypothetical protein